MPGHHIIVHERIFAYIFFMARQRNWNEFSKKKKTISISHYQLIYTNVYVHACIVGETNLQGGNGSANHHKQTDGLASKPTH